MIVSAAQILRNGTVRDSPLCSRDVLVDAGRWVASALRLNNVRSEQAPINGLLRQGKFTNGAFGYVLSNAVLSAVVTDVQRGGRQDTIDALNDPERREAAVQLLAWNQAMCCAIAHTDSLSNKAIVRRGVWDIIPDDVYVAVPTQSAGVATELFKAVYRASRIADVRITERDVADSIVERNEIVKIFADYVHEIACINYKHAITLAAHGQKYNNDA